MFLTTKGAIPPIIRYKNDRALNTEVPQTSLKKALFGVLYIKGKW